MAGEVEICSDNESSEYQYTILWIRSPQYEEVYPDVKSHPQESRTCEWHRDYSILPQLPANSDRFYSSIALSHCFLALFALPTTSPAEPCTWPRQTTVTVYLKSKQSLLFQSVLSCVLQLSFDNAAAKLAASLPVLFRSRWPTGDCNAWQSARSPLFDQQCMSQQTGDVETMLVSCWASVVDGGPILNQHLSNVSC